MATMKNVHSSDMNEDEFEISINQLDAKSVGNAIRWFREEAGLTRHDAARRCMKTAQKWRQYELGLLRPRLETLKHMAAAVGVTYEQILQRAYEL